LDVVVESISQSKQQVKFVFENNKEVWKSVSFSQIVCGNNPLRQRAKKAGAPAPAADAKNGEAASDDPDAFLENMEKKFGTDEARARRNAGPGLSRVPQAWAMPEVVAIVDDGRTVDIDSSPERAPQPKEAADPDPYGLEGDPSLAATAKRPASGAGAGDAKARRGGSPERRSASGSGDRAAKKRRKISRSREAAGGGSKRPAARSRSRGGTKAKRRERSSKRSASERSGSGDSRQDRRQRRRGSDRASPAGKRRRR